MPCPRRLKKPGSYRRPICNRLAGRNYEAVRLFLDRATAVMPALVVTHVIDLRATCLRPSIFLFARFPISEAQIDKFDWLSGKRTKVNNAATIVSLCHRLDGIPLAIEFAAARLTSMSVEQIDARLHDLFHILSGSRKRLFRGKRRFEH